MRQQNATTRACFSMLAASEVRMGDPESRGIELQAGSSVIPINT
jgi:hypothetical protein